MGANSGTRGYALFAVLLLLVETVHSLRCYQCVSTNNSHPFQCNEFLTSDIDIEPEPCDAVFGAQYCVKHTGRFEATSLDCYQCTSQEELTCGDDKLVINSLIPTNCSHVYNARHCIKSVGLYGGSYIWNLSVVDVECASSGIGTKRFCSALDLGNYCDYVKRQGDKLTYRTCIFTCTGDGCNPAATSGPSIAWIIPIVSLVAYKLLYQR